MKLLALDTSSLACSVALQVDEQVMGRHEEQDRQHTRILVPMISSLLADAGITLRELDAIVLGNGPGSFIGMRIAASVAQGLAFGSDLKIVPASSMAAIAAQVFAEQAVIEVVVAQDAHMQEVYLGIYGPDDDGLPVESVAERLHDQSAIPDLGKENSGQRVAAGHGWQRYPALLEANRSYFADISDIHYPTARYLLPMGAALLRRGAAVEPAAIIPAYLRQKVAEQPASIQLPSALL